MKLNLVLVLVALLLWLWLSLQVVYAATCDEQCPHDGLYIMDDPTFDWMGVDEQPHLPNQCTKSNPIIQQTECLWELAYRKLNISRIQAAVDTGDHNGLTASGLLELFNNMTSVNAMLTEQVDNIITVLLERLYNGTLSNWDNALPAIANRQNNKLVIVGYFGPCEEDVISWCTVYNFKNNLSEITCNLMADNETKVWSGSGWNQCPFLLLGLYPYASMVQAVTIDNNLVSHLMSITIPDNLYDLMIRDYDMWNPVSLDTWHYSLISYYLLSNLEYIKVYISDRYKEQLKQIENSIALTNPTERAVFYLADQIQQLKDAFKNYPYYQEFNIINSSDASFDFNLEAAYRGFLPELYLPVRHVDCTGIPQQLCPGNLVNNEDYNNLWKLVWHANEPTLTPTNAYNEPLLTETNRQRFQMLQIPLDNNHDLLLNISFTVGEWKFTVGGSGSYNNKYLAAEVVPMYFHTTLNNTLAFTMDCNSAIDDYWQNYGGLYVMYYAVDQYDICAKFKDCERINYLDLFLNSVEWDSNPTTNKNEISYLNFEVTITVNHLFVVVKDAVSLPTNLKFDSNEVKFYINITHMVDSTTIYNQSIHTSNINGIAPATIIFESQQLFGIELQLANPSYTFKPNLDDMYAMYQKYYTYQGKQQAFYMNVKTYHDLWQQNSDYMMGMGFLVDPIFMFDVGQHWSTDYEQLQMGSIFKNVAGANFPANGGTNLFSCQQWRTGGSGDKEFNAEPLFEHYTLNTLYKDTIFKWLAINSVPNFWTTNTQTTKANGGVIWSADPAIKLGVVSNHGNQWLQYSIATDATWGGPTIYNNNEDVISWQISNLYDDVQHIQSQINSINQQLVYLNAVVDSLQNQIQAMQPGVFENVLNVLTLVGSAVDIFALAGTALIALGKSNKYVAGIKRSSKADDMFADTLVETYNERLINSYYPGKLNFNSVDDQGIVNNLNNANLYNNLHLGIQIKTPSQLASIDNLQDLTAADSRVRYLNSFARYNDDLEVYNKYKHIMPEHIKGFYPGTTITNGHPIKQLGPLGTSVFEGQLSKAQQALNKGHRYILHSDSNTLYRTRTPSGEGRWNFVSMGVADYGINSAGPNVGKFWKQKVGVNVIQYTDDWKVIPWYQINIAGKKFSEDDVFKYYRNVFGSDQRLGYPTTADQAWQRIVNAVENKAITRTSYDISTDSVISELAQAAIVRTLLESDGHLYNLVNQNCQKFSNAYRDLMQKGVFSGWFSNSDYHKISQYIEKQKSQLFNKAVDNKNYKFWGVSETQMFVTNQIQNLLTCTKITLSKLNMLTYYTLYSPTPIWSLLCKRYTSCCIFT